MMELNTSEGSEPRYTLRDVRRHGSWGLSASQSIQALIRRQLSVAHLVASRSVFGYPSGDMAPASRRNANSLVLDRVRQRKIA